eukprot:5144083-Pyramimonas_sp.AAC.1
MFVQVVVVLLVRSSVGQPSRRVKSAVGTGPAGGRRWRCASSAYGRASGRAAHRSGRRWSRPPRLGRTAAGRPRPRSRSGRRRCARRGLG